VFPWFGEIGVGVPARGRYPLLPELEESTERLAAARDRNRPARPRPEILRPAS
jgi:hypothetical protein